MSDTIYSNEKPLGLMDPALREELREYSDAGEKVEIYAGDDTWISVTSLELNGCVYRAVKEPVVTKVWQNVYPDGDQVDVDLYSRLSREHADNDAEPERIAVIRTETIDGVSKVYLEDV